MPDELGWLEQAAGVRSAQLKCAAAIAATATRLASQGSLTAALDAVAAEVVRTDGLAAVQIVTLDDGGRLRIMGSAGFRRWPDFFDRLTRVRERGGRLRMLEALASGQPVLVPRRWTAIQHDPAWEPLGDYLRELPWDSFASVPLLVRGQPVGVLNAFFTPAQVVGQHAVDFLVAMAEQAAIAVDYATLLDRERGVARREERQRLARDLHDSIVQQVFSISMQARSMELAGRRGDSVPAQTVRRVAGEVAALSDAVLADLRALLDELRPLPAAEPDGLAAAIRRLAGTTTSQTGLRCQLSLGRGLDRVDGELAEDVYRIVAEAVHNVVKHADAGAVGIRMAVRDNRISATVTDNGRGIGAAGPDGGHGLRTMRERAQRWNGMVTVTSSRSGGTTVRLAVPLAATGLPVAQAS